MLNGNMLEVVVNHAGQWQEVVICLLGIRICMILPRFLLIDLILLNFERLTLSVSQGFAFLSQLHWLPLSFRTKKICSSKQEQPTNLLPLLCFSACLSLSLSLSLSQPSFQLNKYMNYKSVIPKEAHKSRSEIRLALALR